MVSTMIRPDSGSFFQCQRRPGFLAAGGLYAVRHTGALPHVRRGNPERPDSPGVLRGPRHGYGDNDTAYGHLARPGGFPGQEKRLTHVKFVHRASIPPFSLRAAFKNWYICPN